jgi:hypothetical protein
LKTNQVKKFYLARVTGHFRGNEATNQTKEIYLENQFWHVTKSLQRINDRRGIWRAIDDNVPICTPNQVVSDNVAKQNVIRSAHTMFRCLGYDPTTNTSLVFCAPITGRTHQIREHLRVLDHQIINDDEHLIEDLVDENKGSQGWRFKMDAIKQFQGDRNKCFEYFLNQSMEEFFQRTLIPGEYHIDLHALHYCVKLVRNDILEMKELRKRKRHPSEAKQKKIEQRATKRMKRMAQIQERGVTQDGQDEQNETRNEQDNQDDEQEGKPEEEPVKVTALHEDIPQEQIMDFETKLLPTWCQVFENETHFHEVLHLCVEESKQYAYKHHYYDDEDYEE